jgi:hypothetical protein
MKILSPIVEPAAGDVSRRHAKITQCCAMRWQFVCHDSGWTEALRLEKLSHEFQRGLLVSSRLHQNVEDLAFTIDRAPQIHTFAVHRNEDLIQMPARICPRMCLPERLGVGEAKLDRPATGHFIYRSMPRWASRSSTSRRLNGNRKYGQTACWITSMGKR